MTMKIHTFRNVLLDHEDFVSAKSFYNDFEQLL